MEIRLSNTLSGKIETFKPLAPGKAGLYVCGLTPYGPAHLGHARCYVFFDIVRRSLAAAGYEVLHIQNFTDIDDRIIELAAAENITPASLAGRFIDEYFAGMDALNVLRAREYPRVTQYIKPIIELTQKLIDENFAYVAGNGDVYFSVGRFKDYGKLSKRNKKELLSGARVEVSADKRDPLDFALWKSAQSAAQQALKGNEAAVWDSPWGRGRPGWHIECSVMSTRYLGQPFDIHGGGEDLIFPHHENEIAQSESAHGKPLARYFIHNGFVTINNEKMSKSLENFFAMTDILKKFEPQVVRYYILTEHYRRPLDFSDQALEEAKSALARIAEALEQAFFVTGGNGGHAVGPACGPLGRAVLGRLCDDFHTPSALALLQDWASSVFERFKAKRAGAAVMRQELEDALYSLNTLLGLNISVALPESSAEITALIAQRERCRQSKDFSKADEIRRQLTLKHSVLIEDTPYGPRLKKIK